MSELSKIALMRFVVQTLEKNDYWYLAVWNAHATSVASLVVQSRLFGEIELIKIFFMDWFDAMLSVIFFVFW